MIYIKANSSFSQVFNTYSIIDYSVNKLNKSINFKIQSIVIGEDGIPVTSIMQESIMDILETIVDPNWTIESTPIPKPAEFDFNDPTTWDNLSWDDIPKVTNPAKLYVTNILNSNADIEQSIFEKMIELTKIPSGGQFV